MTHFDITQTPVTLSTAEARESWNAMVRGFLAHCASTPTHLGAVLNAEPDFALGHAAKGLFSMMMGRRELTATAREALSAAKACASNDPREAHWIAALEHWLSGRPSGAIAEIERHLETTPTDTLSAKVSHAIRFILGDATGMRSSIEAVLPAHGLDHPLRGFALGCHAFCLEETGDYAAAERAGLDGLRYATDDAWGLHAVAHVYDMTADPARGIELIETNQAAWGHCNNFRFHVWWHKALLHMDRGEHDIALALYDQKIRNEKTDDYRDISNATSLLMRLELDGLDVGQRWEELADFSENRTEDGCLVFADLHYMLALASAGRRGAQDDLIARFKRDARQLGEMPARVDHPGLAAIEGLNAFAEGRYGTAFQHLAAARPVMQTIGGSHAQRDVFERMTIDAGLRAGLVEETETVLAERMAQRGGTKDRFTATRFAALAEARRIPAQ